MLTLRYFGSFEARLDGSPISLPTRPCARLLALLATEPGHRWRREAVAREIWPDAEWGTEGVSLRTALTMLRRSLGSGAIGSDRERVWIESGAVASDRERCADRLRRADLETDADRRDALLAELADTPAAFLEGWDAPWITPLRAAHAREIARVLLDLSRARLASGRYEDARDLALRSLAARPGNEGAIAVAMRAAAALGDRDEALELAAGRDGSPELRALARDLRATAPVAKPPAPETELLFEAFESNLREDPEVAVRFLLSNAGYWRRQREIARGKSLLLRALEVEGLSDELRGRVVWRLAYLHGRTSDYEAAFATLEEGARMLGPAHPLALDAESFRAFLLYEVGRYDESRAAFDAVIARMPETPGDHRLPFALANRAGLRWQTLDLAGGEADYARALAAYGSEGPFEPYVRAVIETNYACIAHVRGEWDLAERRASAGRSVIDVHLDPFMLPMADAMYLLARAAGGDPTVGPRLARTPLDLVRAGTRRLALVIMDAVAEGFARLGRGTAASELVDAVGALRASLGHLRSPAEELVAARTRAFARDLPSDAIPPAPKDDYAALASWVVARGDEI